MKSSQPYPCSHEVLQILPHQILMMTPKWVMGFQEGAYEGFASRFRRAERRKSLRSDWLLDVIHGMRTVLVLFLFAGMVVCMGSFLDACWRVMCTSGWMSCAMLSLQD